MNETVIPMRIEGGEIQIKASVGQTVIKVVAPDEYTGDTTITPSDETQTLETRDKLVREDITINPAPTETLSTDHNGTFTPSDGKVGFYQVDVDVNPDLRPLSVSENGEYQPDGFDGYSSVVVDAPIGEWNKGTLIYEGDFEAATNAFSVTELPNGEPFSFDRVVVEWSNVQQGQNVDKRTYWRSDKPMSGYNELLISDRGTAYRQNITYGAVTDLVIEGDTYISVSSNTYDEDNPTSTTCGFVRKEHSGYDKITAYAWWAWNCPAGTHIKITGYNRTS